MNLLPINTRVTHFDGGPDTHGKGTIIGYNGVQSNTYLKENFKEGVEMAAEAGLLGAVIASMYSSDRCPYVVKFDPREKYPEGYQDVYEASSINELKLSEIEEIRRRVLEKNLGVSITQYTPEQWLDKAIESEAIAKSGRTDIVSQHWFETSIMQFKAAELAEKLA